VFTHVFLGSNDIERSRVFYDATMGALGYTRVSANDAPRLVYSGGGQSLIISKPFNGRPATCANGATLGLRADSKGAVDRFHAAGLASGGTEEGPPSARSNAPNDAYGAYLKDPDGHKICAFYGLSDDD
jgi:catechol 2,3-dioxygenase-like lactoylglutathione lyase family enzyme